MQATLSRRRRLPLLLGALGLLALAGAGLAWRLGTPPQPEFLSAPVVRGDLEDAVMAIGVLQPLRQVEVGAQANGQLKSLKVKLGDHVKRGDLLAQIDAVQPHNVLLQAEAALAALQARRDSNQARLRQARLEWQRQRDMRAHDASAEQDLVAAQAELRAQEAALRETAAEIAQQRSRVAAARTDLGFTRITAPMDGEVVALNTLEGQTVVASYQVPNILKLADLSTMTVRAQVSEADVIRIREQQPVYFTVLGAPDRRYHGRLRAIQPSPEKINNAVFFNALFDVPNPDRSLRIDMTAQVSIVLGAVKQAVLVPLSALGPRRPDGRFPARVLHADGSVEHRQVRTGLRNNVNAQVLEGLREGERVVTGDSTDAAAPAPASNRAARQARGPALAARPATSRSA